MIIIHKNKVILLCNGISGLSKRSLSQIHKLQQAERFNLGNSELDSATKTQRLAFIFFNLLHKDGNRNTTDSSHIVH